MSLPLGSVFYSLLLQFPYDPTHGEKEPLPATDKLIKQVNRSLITYLSVLAGQKEPTPLGLLLSGTKKWWP